MQEIFRDLFDDEELVVTRKTTANDVEGWDSLMHVEIIVATERHFKVAFAVAEISAMNEDGRNLGDFIEMVQGKIGPPA